LPPCRDHTLRLKYTQILFQPGLRPTTRWGIFSASPGPLAGFMGLLLRGGRGKEKAGERRENKGDDGMEGEGKIGEEM